MSLVALSSLSKSMHKRVNSLHMGRHAIIFHVINNAIGDKVHLVSNFNTQLKKDLHLYSRYELTPLAAATRIENGVVCILFEATLQHATCVI